MEQLHWLASSPCLAYNVQDTGIVISYCILGKSLRRVQVLRAQWCVHEPCQPQAAFLSGSRSERADEAPSFPSVCTNDDCIPYSYLGALAGQLRIVRNWFVDLCIVNYEGFRSHRRGLIEIVRFVCPNVFGYENHLLEII